jgi:hypothetical protein
VKAEAGLEAGWGKWRVVEEHSGGLVMGLSNWDPPIGTKAGRSDTWAGIEESMAPPGSTVDDERPPELCARGTIERESSVKDKGPPWLT